MGDMSLITAYEQMHEAAANAQHATVVRLARHVLLYFPHIIKAKLLLCDSLLANAENDEAEGLFHDVLHVDPESIDAYVGLSTIAERRGDLAAAAQFLEHAIEMRPEVVDIRTRLVNLYRRAARHDVYLQLSRIGLARLFVKGSMFEQAISEFRSLQQLHPERIDITTALAETLWRNGDEREAFEISQVLLQREPDVLKAQYIVARYQAGRDSELSQRSWAHAQMFDPFFDVARELFGHATLPSAPAWLLPEFPAADQVGVKAARASAVQSKEVLFPAIPDLDHAAVLHDMRTQPRHGIYAQTDDCACMGEGGHGDSHEPVAVSAGVADVTAPSLLAGMLDQPLRPAAAVPATDALPYAPSHDQTVEILRGGRETTPVEPEHTDVVTETVQTYAQPVANPRGMPFVTHQPIDEDDRFLATVLSAGDAGADSAADYDSRGRAAVAAPIKLSINTTQLQTITSLDDLYALLARLEISHTPSPTEDLREVVARILGNGFVDAKKVTPVPDPRFSRQASHAAAATHDALIERTKSDRRSARPVRPAVPAQKTAPAAEAPTADPLLADLFLSSRSAEMPAAISAALPRASDGKPVPTGPAIEMPPPRALPSVNASVATATPQPAAAAPDNDMLSSLLATTLPQRSGAAPVAFDLSNLAVSQGMRLQDFPDTGARPAVDAERVLREVGVTTGEISRSGAAAGTVAAADALLNPSSGVNPAPAVAKPDVVAAPGEPTAQPHAKAVGLGTPVTQSRRSQTTGTTTTQINEYLRQLQDDPENASMRLAVARAASNTTMFETALVQYRHLIRTTMLLDDVVTDLRALLANESDAQKRRECSRLLGNAYARQGKVQEAVEAYRMTNMSGPPPAL
ncbi:MAG: hypothetical protein RLZZ297_10 [Chloroflexota bacterium]